MIFPTKIAEAKTAVEAALTALNAAYDHTPDIRAHEELDTLRGTMLDIVKAVRAIPDTKSGILTLTVQDELFHDDADGVSYKAVVTRELPSRPTAAYAVEVVVFSLNGEKWTFEDNIHLTTATGYIIERARFWSEIFEALKSFYEN